MSWQLTLCDEVDYFEFTFKSHSECRERLRERRHAASLCSASAKRMTMLLPVALTCDRSAKREIQRKCPSVVYDSRLRSQFAMKTS